MRRWLRRILILVLALLGTVAATPLLVTVALRFAIVRDVVRAEVEQILDDVLIGEARIGEIEALGFTGAIVRDVVITDAEGRPAIRVERAAVEVSPLALISHRIQVDRVELRRPRVMMVTEADGTLNLARLVPTSSPTPDAGPFTWTVSVATASVARARIEYRTATATRTVDGIAIGGRFHLAEGVIEVSQLAVDAEGHPTLRDARMTWATTSGRLDAHARLELAPELARILSGQAQLRGGAALTVSVQQADAQSDLAIAALGTLADAPLIASATVAPDLAHAQLSVRLDGLDPAAVHGAAPAGNVTLSAQGDVRALDPLDAELTVDAHGKLAAPGRQPGPFVLVARATAGEGIVGGSLSLQGLGASVAGRARGRTVGDSVEIDEARIIANASGLDVLTLGAVSGSLTATITAHGPLDALAVSGQIRGRRLLAAPVSMSSLTVKAQLTGVPSAIEGPLTLAATELGVDGERLGDLDLSARVHQEGTRLDTELKLRGGRRLRALTAQLAARRDDAELGFTIRTLVAETAGARWRIDDAHVERANDGGLTVHALHLKSRRGSIRVDAELGPRPLETPGWVRAELVELDVGAVVRDLSLPWPGLTGLTSARVSARTGPAPELDVVATIEALSYPGLAGTARGTAAVKLTSGTVTASLAIDGADLGHVRLDAVLTAPRAPYVPADWAALGVRSVQSVTGHIERLQLARLGPLGSFLGGTLDLDVDAGRALERVQVELRARGVRHRQLPGPFTLNATAHAGPGSTSLAASLGIADVPLAAVAVGVDAGVRAWLADPAGVARATNGKLDLELSSFPVALMEDFAPEPPGIRVAPRRQALGGEVTLRGKFRREAKHYRGTLTGEGRDVRWFEGAPPVTATAAVSLDDTKLTLTGRVHGARLGVLGVEARAYAPRDLLDPSAWIARGTSALESVVLDARGLDLAVLDRLSDRRLALVGSVTARVEGSDALRTLDGYVKVLGVGRRDSDVRTSGVLALVGRRQRTSGDLTLYDHGHLILTGTVSAPLSPAAMLHGRVDWAQIPLEASATLDQFPLRTIAASAGLGIPVGGTLTASATFRGTSREYTARAHVDASQAIVDTQRFDKFLADVVLDPRSVHAVVHARGAKDASTLDLDADLDLSRGGVLDARLRAERFRLDFVSMFLQRAGSVGGVTGVLDADARLRGTPEAPSGSGRIHIDELGLVLAAPLPPIAGMRIEVGLQDRQVTARFSGRSARGTLGGDMNATFTTLRRPKFTLHLNTEGVAMVVGPRQALIASAVTVTGEVADVIEVDVSIDSASVEIPNSSGEQLASVRKLPDVVFTDAGRRTLTTTVAAPATPIRARVHSKGDIPIQGSEVSARARVDLRFDGTGGVMTGSGQVSVGEGWVSLFGKRWQIERADIVLIGKEEPRVEVEISRDLGSALAIVRVRGSIDQPKLELTSDPPIFDEAEVLMFVLGADPGSADEATSLEDRAAGAAVGALVGALQSELEDTLPIDTIDVKVEDGARISQLEVGKWITSRIFLGYQYAFEADSDENTNEALVEVRLGRGWVLESRYGDRGVGGIDFIWVHRF